MPNLHFFKLTVLNYAISMHNNLNFLACRYLGCPSPDCLDKWDFTIFIEFQEKTCACNLSLSFPPSLSLSHPLTLGSFGLEYCKYQEPCTINNLVYLTSWPGCVCSIFLQSHIFCLHYYGDFGHAAKKEWEST